MKPILIFCLIYLLGSSLFLVGHFSNQSSGMVDVEVNLSSEDILLQKDILSYRIPDASLRGADWGVIKRSIWDGIPLLLIFIWSIFIYQRNRNQLTGEIKNFVKINLVGFSVLLSFIISVEVINLVLYLNDRTPIFLEHLRLMRFVGFLLVNQAVFILYYLSQFSYQRLRAGILGIILFFSPLVFSAPIVRAVVRVIIPENIRVRYNLAPVVSEVGVKDQANLIEVAYWARTNIPHDNSKFFVFDGAQEDFKFKVMSRHETNLTAKEGSIWVTSGFENSKRWYDERKRYEDVVGSAKNFSEIIAFAKELDCTHILIPRGKFLDLYRLSEKPIGKIVYENLDYTIVEF